MTWASSAEAQVALLPSGQASWGPCLRLELPSCEDREPRGVSSVRMGGNGHVVCVYECLGRLYLLIGGVGRAGAVVAVCDAAGRRGVVDRHGDPARWTWYPVSLLRV